MTNLLVRSVVGDELRVPAERAVERTPDRPHGRIAESVVGEIVAEPHRHEALPGAIDLLPFPVLREGHRLHLLRGQQRQERVAHDLAVALEPEIPDAGVVMVGFEQSVQLLERELALAHADRVDVGEDRVFGMDDRMDPTPDDERRGGDFTQPLDDLTGEVRVAGHRREADDVGAAQPCGDLVDLLRAEIAAPAIAPGDRALESAIAVGRDVVRLRVRFEARGVRRDLAEPAGRDPVLEANQSDSDRRTVTRRLCAV